MRFDYLSYPKRIRFAHGANSLATREIYQSFYLVTPLYDCDMDMKVQHLDECEKQSNRRRRNKESDLPRVYTQRHESASRSDRPALNFDSLLIEFVDRRSQSLVFDLKKS
jgi:hypothetical protein